MIKITWKINIKMIKKNNLFINEKLYNFVNEKIIPGTGINIDKFWSNFSKIVVELDPINKIF